MDDLAELTEFAIDIADGAGEITLKYFGTELEIESKADQSPVTIADRESEQYLRGEIEKRFPDDGILGEEFGEKKGTSGRRWILDPIDGTKSFIRGVPLYGTMVAVEVEARPVVGVIRFAPLGETIAAFEGGGCRVNGEPCAVSETTDIASALALTTDFAYFRTYLGQAALSNYLASTGLQRTWGDCYGYLMLATGRADVMVDPIMNYWDVAALIPIVTEAGGRITDITGSDSPQMKTCVATNGPLHEAVLKLVSA